MSEFLADAAVLIRADTTAFRSQLLAEVNSAVASAQAAVKPITVPVAAAPTAAATAAARVVQEQTAATIAGATAASAALDKQTRSVAALGATQAKLRSDQATAIRLNNLLRATTEAVALADQKVVGAVSARAAAQEALRREQAAGVAAQRLLTAATLAGISATELAATATIEEALAHGRNAAAKLADASSTRAVERSTRGIAKGAGSAGAALAGLRGATLAANASFIAGAVAAITFGRAVGSAAKFEQDLNVFRVTVGATGDEMERVSAQAQQLGRDITLPGVNASDAAEAMSLLARAGLSVQDSLEGARGVLQLATAAQISNAEATQLAASALNAFGLNGSEAIRVADVLANAANASQASITDMGIALQQSSAVARQVGISFEDTATFLTLLAKNGLQGSDAGTSLRVALTRLINPTEKALTVINKLGVQIRDLNGNIRPEVFTDFANAQADLSRKQQDANAAIVFGTDALRAYSIISREGLSTFTETADALGKQGTAAEVAAARMSGLAGDAENAKNQFAAFGLTLGRVAQGPLGAIVRGFGNLGESLNIAAEKIGAFVNPPEFDAAQSNFRQLADRAFELRLALEDAGEVDLALELQKSLKEVEAELAKAGQRLVRQGFLTRFIETFKQLSPEVKAAMEDNVITPAEQAQLAASGIGTAFLEALPHTARFFESFGLSARSAIEEAATEVRTSKEFGAALRSSIEDASAEAKTQAAASGQEVGSEYSRGMVAGLRAQAGADQFFRAAAESARLGIAKAASQVIDVEFRGGSQRELRAALQKQLEDQTDLVEILVRRGAPQKKIDAAKQAATSTFNQIESINQEFAADAKEAATKAEKVRREADENLLNALGLGRQAAEQAVARAQASERTTDDIPALLAFRKRLQNEIRQISVGVKDGQVKARELKRLSDELFQNSLDIQAARKARNDALAASVEEQRADLRAAAEATGNTAILIRLLDQDIADARQVLAKARAAKEGQQVAAEALKALQKEKRDLINSAREDVLASAFRIAEAQGNESLMLQILDLQIAQAKREVTQAKGLAEKLKEQADVQDLINQRRELLAEKVEEGQKGTTAFDLLKQFADTFNQNAGNLIGADQPFAGPTGFTADIAQFLRRRQGGGAAARPDTEMRVDRVRVSKQASEANKVMRDLITALQQLTNVTAAASGNRSTVIPKAAVTAVGQRWTEVAKFYQSRQAQAAIDAGGGVN